MITLAIIGVVAAMTIPSVIVNTNQQEFKTGLRKAVSVLNSAITMNNALEGETPYDNADLFTYLQQHMSVLKSTTGLSFRDKGTCTPGTTTCNASFYTTDGMRFEIPTKEISKNTHEANNVAFNTGNKAGNCGAQTITAGTSTTTNPCLIMVDVNGDRKPNPANENIGTTAYSWPRHNEKLLKDVFSIMITDEKAIPFGVVAQRAMYQSKN